MFHSETNLSLIEDNEKSMFFLDTTDITNRHKMKENPIGIFRRAIPFRVPCASERKAPDMSNDSTTTHRSCVGIMGRMGVVACSYSKI